jgi:hypothetical protein
MAHFAGKGTASGEQTKGTVSERVPSNGSRATEALREYRSVVGRTWRSSAAVVQMRDQLDQVDISAEPPPERPRESTLRKEVSLLKRLLAEKTLEVDFFRGALRKVEARRQKGGTSGEKASTTKSKK